MRISLIHPADLGASEILAWHAMQRATGSLMNPFLCPEFAIGVGKFRPDSRLAVLTTGSGEIAGFLPFERRGFGMGVPIGAGLSNCQGLIHVPGLAWDAREILFGCRISAWQFDNLVPGQTPFERYAAAQTPAGIINLADGFAAYREKLKVRSAQFLKELDRKARKLERERGGTRFVSDSRDPAALRTLIRWKSAQCRRNTWLNVFERPWVERLVYHIFATQRPPGDHMFSPALSMLYAGETPVAGQFGLRCGSYFAGWFTAYDPEFAAYSPGLVQVMRLAEELTGAGATVLEMGGTAHYQEKLKSHDMYFTKGMVTSGPLTAAAHRTRQASAAWARGRVRQCPPLFRAADCVLRRSGRIT